MTDESKPLIVEGEEVGDYNDTTFSFGKWQMATVELWESPKEFDAYQYDYEAFSEFYKPENDDYKYDGNGCRRRYFSFFRKKKTKLEK